MATSTIHATNGASMNCSTVCPPDGSSAARGGAVGVRMRQCGHEPVDQLEIGGYAVRPAYVRRNNHSLGACARGHLANLVVVEVPGRHQHAHLPLPHQLDQL